MSDAEYKARTEASFDKVRDAWYAGDGRGEFEALCCGFDGGYAAASADTERLVRKAVEATREKAAQEVCASCRTSDEVIRITADGPFLHTYHWTTGGPVGYTGTLVCKASSIRALGVEQIIAGVRD